MIAEGWKNELPESHRIALDIAYSDFLDAYFHLPPTEAGKLERVAEALPKRYSTRYSPLFCHRFIICMSSVAERLVQPERIAPIPRCTAEALALHILIEHATALLKDVRRIDADFCEFMTQAFRDTDFLKLYEANEDGSKASPADGSSVPKHLDLNDWFIPFDRHVPVNPFVYEDWTTEQAGINFYR
ncbi:MAG: hypothetical protein O2913_05670 [Chloroflexi bacterium]|nr:hypothetical protein [Chloroflexota bacterium]